MEEKRNKLFIPENIKIEELEDGRCKLVVSPLASGFGITIGNALRRVLLAYIPGYAIHTIFIKGVKHEFASIEGVRQDVLTIVLNLKQIILKRKKDANEDNEEIHIVKKNGVFTGKDITAASKNFEVVNGAFEICDFSKDVDFDITLYVNKGVGYIPAKQFDNSNDKIGTIHIDSIYSPIVNVEYDVDEKFHFNEENRNYDCLTMVIESNGAVSAKDSISLAAHILVQHLNLFLLDKNYADSAEDDFIDQMNSEKIKTKILLSKSIKEINFSSRALNCFEKAKISTVKDLISTPESELLNMRNFGKKTLKEIRDFMTENKLYHNFDIEEQIAYEEGEEV